MAADALSGAMGVHSDDLEMILKELLDLMTGQSPISEEEKRRKEKCSKTKIRRSTGKEKELIQILPFLLAREELLVSIRRGWYEEVFS